MMIRDEPCVDALATRGFAKEPAGGGHTRQQEERQADGESDDDEEPGEQHGGRSRLAARQELSTTGAQDAPA